MPPLDEPAKQKDLRDVVEEIGLYPIDAYNFVRKGLHYTVQQIHGEAVAADPDADRHVSGPQLCQGLRDFALNEWGMMAPTVLRRWNVTSTFDFGRIVFAFVDNGLMHATEQDKLDDFRNVFDFRTAFEASYKIECKG